MTKATVVRDIFNLPNMLTLLRIAIIPVICLFIFLGDPMSGLLSVVLFAAAGATDWFDGYLARKRDLVSLTGKFLDPLADKLLVLGALVMLLPVGRISPWIVLILLARELAVMGLRSIAAGEDFIMAAGRGGKFKTAFQMTGLIGLMIHYEYTVNYFGLSVSINFHRIGFWLIVLSVVFSLTSAYQYFRSFIRGVEEVKTA
jgi:CDP-diacylglycerol--glycerol-3-phosphate 3-phosphatidyltransferase